jgi:ribose 5-phosphate isomerase RpiB
MMRIAVRSDHAGVPLNEAAIAELRSLGHEVVETAEVVYADRLHQAPHSTSHQTGERSISLESDHLTSVRRLFPFSTI